MSVLTPRIDVFILRATRLSNKLLEQGYVKERLKSSLKEVLWSIRGSYKTIWSFPLRNVTSTLILWPNRIQWQTRTDQILYRTRPFTEFWEVSIEHLRRMWHANRERLLLRTPDPSLWDFHMFYLMRPILFPNASLFSGLCSSNTFYIYLKKKPYHSKNSFRFHLK